eukprot:jgi/Botrbrau1/8730/Bobra.0090s0006.1
MDFFKQILKSPYVGKKAGGEGISTRCTASHIAKWASSC